MFSKSPTYLRSKPFFTLGLALTTTSLTAAGLEGLLTWTPSMARARGLLGVSCTVVGGGVLAVGATMLFREK